MKVALCLIGECFREGGQGTRVRGTTISYNEQKAASKTHMDYVLHNAKLGVATDIFIHSFSTKFDADLLSWYAPYLKKNILHKTHVTTNLQSHIDILLPSVPISVYDMLIFIRIDLFLKPYFFEMANITKITKISFPFVTWKKRDYTPYRNPRVADTMMFVPKPYYELLFDKKLKIIHNAWDIVNLYKLDHSIFDVLAKTYHDSDSNKDWNPFYQICGREAINTWESKDAVFNDLTRLPVTPLRDNVFYNHVFDLYKKECM